MASLDVMINEYYVNAVIKSLVHRPFSNITPQVNRAKHSDLISVYTAIHSLLAGKTSAHI